MCQKNDDDTPNSDWSYSNLQARNKYYGPYTNILCLDEHSIADNQTFTPVYGIEVYNLADLLFFSGIESLFGLSCSSREQLHGLSM